MKGRERKRKKLLSTCLFFKGAQWLKPSDARTLELHLGLSPGHLPLSSQVCQQELDQKQSGWNVNLYSNVECWCHRQCFTVPQCWWLNRLPGDQPEVLWWTGNSNWQVVNFNPDKAYWRLMLKHKADSWLLSVSIDWLKRAEPGFSGLGEQWPYFPGLCFFLLSAPGWVFCTDAVTLKIAVLLTTASTARPSLS